MHIKGMMCLGMHGCRAAQPALVAHAQLQQRQAGLHHPLWPHHRLHLLAIGGAEVGLPAWGLIYVMQHVLHGAS